MILEVLKYPDPRLREKSEPVTEFGPDVKKFAEDLLETMYAEKGIGLAAPQVGKLWTMLAVDARPKDKGGRYKIEEVTELEQKVQQPLIVINPRIVKGEGKTTFEEGCLSIPSFFETVERIRTIELEYQDITGKKHILTVDGLTAIVIQHEMDHLDGTLFIDHLSLVKSSKIKNQIKKYGYPEKKSSEQDEEEAQEL